jgi:hypothetical protein
LYGEAALNFRNCRVRPRSIEHDGSIQRHAKPLDIRDVAEQHT